MTASKPEVVAYLNFGVLTGEPIACNDCWSELASEPLIKLTDHEAAMASTESAGSYQRGYDEGRSQGTRHRIAEIQQLESNRAADKARIAELVEALESMTCAYRMAIQAGHARITALGGDCDSVDRMLADFPDYGRSVDLHKSCRAALAQQGKEGE